MSVADPYVFSTCYAFALMLLCTECWFRSDPWLFNHSPLYLFRAPGEPSKAPAPMTPYTRVFSAWHAGGVCFCFFMSLLGMGFPVQQKKEVSLALGLLWIIWGTTNSWRAIYGKAEFYRPGAAMHSLIGGCGICGFWNLAYWLSHTTALRFADYPLAPLLIGFILGGMLEDNFARSLQLYDGIGFIVERPMTLALLVLAVLLVLLPSYRARRARIRAQGVADAD